MKRTHPYDHGPEMPGFGYEPVPDLQIIPVPTTPSYKPPAGVIIQRIPRDGPLPGEQPLRRKPRLN